jgi:hypothetical protein
VAAVARGGSSPEIYRATLDFIGANATRRRGEDVGSNRLSKGQKRLLVRRKRVTKGEGEAAEFGID